MAPVVGHVYATRQRVRAERVAKSDERYDDIFSAVTRRVQDEGQFTGLSRRLIEENTVSVRKLLFSQSSNSSMSSHESDDDSDETSRDDNSISGPSAPSTICRSIIKEGVIQKCQLKRKKKIDDVDVWRQGDKKGKFICGQCPLHFDRHMQLHRHVLKEHEGHSCSSCSLPWRALRSRHQCCKCAEFCVEIDKHLIDKHYAQSSRPGALLECSRCPRTYTNLKEVMHHEKVVHGLINKPGVTKRAAIAVKKTRPFSCRACGESFGSRYLRDSHLTSHFQSVIDSVWITIERMQEEHPEGVHMNQCPLCLFIMSSRKSFRTHVVHRHLMYDDRSLDMLVGPNVKEEELATVREHIANEGRRLNENDIYRVQPHIHPLQNVTVPVTKKEVKEEVKEDNVVLVIVEDKNKEEEERSRSDNKVIIDRSNDKNIDDTDSDDIILISSSIVVNNEAK